MAGGMDEMVGKSAGLDQFAPRSRKVARTDAKVLITGESGTGQGAGRARHPQRQPAAPRGPFVKLNCAAIPKDLVESELFGYEKGAFTGATQMKRGRLELADGGTLFLDEIGDMSLETQAKLLRAIETGEIERRRRRRRTIVGRRARSSPRRTRTCAAEIQAGRFREDLFYRLNVVPIHLPPLRERREDIPLLAGAFRARGSPPSTGALRGRSAKEALERLSSYGWPGNIRELRNLIERILIMTDGETVDLDEVEAVLPANADDGPPSEIKVARDKAERDTILATLKQCQWNVTEASRRLGMDRGYLHRKIKRYGLARETAGS